MIIKACGARTVCVKATTMREFPTLGLLFLDATIAITFSRVLLQGWAPSSNMDTSVHS